VMAPWQLPLPECLHRLAQPWMSLPHPQERPHHLRQFVHRNPRAQRTAPRRTRSGEVGKLLARYASPALPIRIEEGWTVLPIREGRYMTTRILTLAA
jgi:hypothetical protein